MTATDPAFDGLTPWPDAQVQAYRAAGLWGDTNLAAWFAQRCQAVSDQPLLSGRAIGSDHWQTLTGRQLLAQTTQLARGLRQLGLGRGDRVVLQMGNSNGFVVTLFALLSLGVIPVMALPGHRRRDIEHFATLTGARAWLAGDAEPGADLPALGDSLRACVDHLQWVILEGESPGPHQSLAGVLALGQDPSPEPLAGLDCDPAGTALLLCSGGTTGLPKLIPRTHRDYLYNASASAEVCELNAADRYLVALPAAHNFPLACPGILGALAVGAGVIMCPSPSPETAFECIERSGATVTALVPPLVKVWLDHAERVRPAPASLRLLQVGGARLEAGVARRVAGGLGCQLQQVFGMAEGLLNFTRAKDPAFLVYSTQGRPLSGLDEVMILDDEGNEVPQGTPGELCTRGPYTLRGYYKNAEANRRSFTADGFYRSGDLVRRLSTGHLVVEGRKREVIRRGAETVSIETLETLLGDHPAIADVAVVGLPCERLGEQVCAALVLADPAAPAPSLAELREFLSRAGVARFMLPDTLAIIAEVPLTAVGKIARQQLARQIHNSRQSILSTEPTQSTQSTQPEQVTQS